LHWSPYNLRSIDNGTKIAAEAGSGSKASIYFGPKPPAGQEANWVPTDPQRGFELRFRAYKKEFFDKAGRCRTSKNRLNERQD